MRCNPVHEQLEYDIIGYFKKHEADKGEWDRRWMPVEVCAQVREFASKRKQWRKAEKRMVKDFVSNSDDSDDSDSDDSDSDDSD